MDQLNTITRYANGPPLRIFLVEDSVEVRDLIIENLAMIPGTMVAGVSDSEADAVEQLSHIACDILIVDIQLKQGNGIDLLRQLSEQKGGPPMKIICSNSTSEFFRDAGRQYGAQYFFDKTSEFPQLFELMKELSHSASRSPD